MSDSNLLLVATSIINLVDLVSFFASVIVSFRLVYWILFIAKNKKYLSIIIKIIIVPFLLIDIFFISFLFYFGPFVFIPIVFFIAVYYFLYKFLKKLFLKKLPKAEDILKSRYFIFLWILISPLLSLLLISLLSGTILAILSTFFPALINNLQNSY